MQRVSSSATILLKFFLPTFWIVFFGAFTLTVFLAGHDHYGNIPASYLQIGSLLFFVLGVAGLYWAVIRLKRVEMDEEFVYVTNYFKTFRYPYHNVKKMEESDYLFFRSMHLHFHQPGSFGKKVTFIVSQKLMDDFLKSNPRVVQHLLGENQENIDKD